MTALARLFAWLAERLGGTSVIVLADDESAVVLRDDRSPSALYLTEHGDELSPGSSVVAAVFLAAAHEPGRLVVALESLESVRR